MANLNNMNIAKNRFSLESEENEKIYEFMSAPSLKGLDELAKFLNCVVYIAKDRIYFFQSNVTHNISIPPRLKDNEFACVILSYEKGE